MYADTNWVYLLAYWCVSGLALRLTAALTPGFRIRGAFTTLAASLLIGAANVAIRPALIFLTLPLTILTLGLFIFVIDAIILRVCASVFEDFEITNWLSAFVGAILLAITSTFLHWILI